MADGPALDGYWLPGLDDGDLDLRVREFGPGGVPVRVPELTPADVTSLADSLVRARSAVAGRSVEEILPVVAAAAARLTRPGGEVHAELLGRLPGLTGYSEEMIALGLKRMGETWSEEALRAALESELGELAVLDGFRPRRPSGLHRAYGPDLVVHIFSGNIPGVAVTSLIRALCVKSASLGKTATGEPYLPVRFARELAALDPELGACLAVTYWAGGREEVEEIAFERADVVVAYGGDDTITKIRRRLPATVRFLPYRNRVGAGLITAEALRRRSLLALARAVASDVAAFDQQGCVAPHVVYVEREADPGPLEFARSLAAQLEALTARLPPGTRGPAESSRIHQLRGAAEVRGATVLASETGTDWTVILEDGAGFEPSPLNRVIQVRIVDRIGDAVAALARVGRHLQTVAVAATPAELDDLSSRLGAIGATRIVPVGSAAWPAPAWHHDGRFGFLDLLRFVDLET